MFRNPSTDLIVVLVIVLLIFGPKRLPGLGKSLGTGLREFKESITGESKDDEAAQRPEITPATAAPTQPAAPTATPVAAPVEPRESAQVGSQPHA
jgi:sec-independent protein translocase protein TatA